MLKPEVTSAKRSVAAVLSFEEKDERPLVAPEATAETRFWTWAALTPISDSPYFTTLLKDTNHVEFLQIMKKDGINTDFTIMYEFTGGEKSLQNRMNNAVSSGENVNWTVKHGESLSTTSNFNNKTWRYSSEGNISSKWTGSGSNFSSDDGAWGAANSNLDGGAPGPALSASNAGFDIKIQMVVMVVVPMSGKMGLSSSRA